MKLHKMIIAANNYEDLNIVKEAIIEAYAKDKHVSANIYRKSDIYLVEIEFALHGKAHKVMTSYFHNHGRSLKQLSTIGILNELI